MSMMRSSQSLVFAMAVSTALGAQDAPAQDKRPIAFTNARIVTVSGSIIERGTLVVRQGVIEAVGSDVVVPAGARVIDASGKTIMPGIVSAFSRAGLRGDAQRTEQPGSGPRRGGRRDGAVPTPTASGAQNQAATRVVDGLYARQDVFGDLLAAGVTSLALTPIGNAFPGTGAVLAPDGKTIDELTLEPAAFVQISMQREAPTKKLLAENFEKAQKVVEERKQPPAKPEPPKPAEKPAEKPPEPGPTEPPKTGEPPKPTPPDPKPEPKPEAKPAATPAPAAAAQNQQPAAKKDPNIELLADLLEGKQRAIVQIDSAADLVHWQAVVKQKFPRTVVATRHDPFSGTLDEVIDQVKQLDCALLLPPNLSTKGRSASMTHPAKTLHDAGIEIGFVVGDSPSNATLLFFQLMELVRCGLPADVALRGVTLVPAKALGIDQRVGTLEVGKDANLILFSGDPLSPESKLDSVWFRGRAVQQKP